ncbi:MAG: hypothetical protein ABI843_05320 [Dokdonella sp.]
MNAAQALAFVERHGVVLEAARHRAIACLADSIAGEPIRGSWWSHPRSREIFAITRTLRDSAELLVCRLVDDKITFAHRRCWPALVRLSARLPSARLARVREVHTEGGRHRIEQTPYPAWLPRDTAAAAQRLTDAEAIATLGMLSFLFEQTP